MKEIGAKMLPIPYPGCEHVKFKSDEYFECLGRHTTATAYKYCGTCLVGKDRSDREAVVDPFLRVFGVKNLRIIDGSVLQESEVSVNQCTAMMLASVSSEMLLDYHENSNEIES